MTEKVQDPNEIFTDMALRFIKRYVLLRSRDQGVVVGRLRAVTCIQGVTLAMLDDAKQLWSWAAAEEELESFTLMAVSEFGAPDGSRISIPKSGTDSFLMSYWCGVYALTDKAYKTFYRERFPEEFPQGWGEPSNEE